MSTLLQLWREVCGRSPALVNQDGKHLIVGEADLILLGSEIERTMLAAAPTPAAQGAGQEAVAERCARVAALRRPEITTVFGVEILTLIHAYQAAVYAYAMASKPRKQQTYVDVLRAENRIIDAFYASAAPVNGGERDDARRMRTLCRLLDAADDLGNGFPGEVHHAFQEGAKVVRDTLDRFALPEDDERTCPGCEGKPAPQNNPCAVCGKRAAEAPQEDGERPSDCSGEPECCPQNEGYGCHCGTRNSAVQRAADAPQVGESLTKEEIDFVLAVFGNPDAKRSYAGDYFPAERPPVWETPELLGLIVATGSYKWRPTEKLRGIMRAALSSPAKDAEQKPMTDRQIIELCKSVGVEWEGPDMCDFMGDFGRVNMAGMRAIINAVKGQK